MHEGLTDEWLINQLSFIYVTKYVIGLLCLVIDILGDAAVLQGWVKSEGEPAGIRQGGCHRQKEQQRPREEVSEEHFGAANSIHLSKVWYPQKALNSS